MQGKGPLSIWYVTDARLDPPTDTEYVIGCDISAGTAGDQSSNSVACVLDRRTGEQVAEYCTMSEDPKRFANTVVALCKLFGGLVVQGRSLTETWVPADEGLGADTRQLGIAVRRIWAA